MNNLAEKLFIDFACETMMEKKSVAALMCEHLQEFEDMYLETVMEKCIDKIVSDEKNCSEKYNFYVLAHSPNITKKHKIIVGIQIKMSPGSDDEMIPVELSDVHQLYFDEKTRMQEEEILRCYGICFYLDPPKKLQNHTVRLRTNFRNMNGSNLLGQDRCDAVVIYLGDIPEEEKKVSVLH